MIKDTINTDMDKNMTEDQQPVPVKQPDEQGGIYIRCI